MNLARASRASRARTSPTRTLPSAASGTLLASGAGALGAALYPRYREIIKPVLFAESPHIGWAFERKEHLAIGAIGKAVQEVVG